METTKTTIEKLLEQGKASGKLTTKEISDALDEMDDTEHIYHNMAISDEVLEAMEE